MVGSTLRVYVGMQTEQTLAFQVLAHSIRKTARIPVEVMALSDALPSAGIAIPEPRSSRNREYTPFSFQRFAIPQLNGYSGTAIYLDSDMLVFRDIGELLDLMPAHADVAAVQERPDSGRKSQISVMVLNCARLDWDVRRVIEDLDLGKYTYPQLYADLPIAKKFERALPSFWNDLERHTPGVTALTHFTDMETQPWLYPEHPLGKVWCEALFAALEAGATTSATVHDHVQRGWIRPSLEYQVDRGLVDPARLPERVVHLDAYGFTPPHRVGILPRKWMRQVARTLTDYGKPSPSPRAKLMRSFQAVGYQAYRRLRGNHLLAH